MHGHTHDGFARARAHTHTSLQVKTVFVERKTHLDAWTGNVSVKERFTLEERLTVAFLNGSYTVNEYADDMKRRGKKDADIQEACKLFSQIARVIQSKQLGPTVRTQYMRTAFQIPFDASVRISLDTNLAMVREDCCGYASTITGACTRVCAFVFVSAAAFRPDTCVCVCVCVSVYTCECVLAQCDIRA